MRPMGSPGYWKTGSVVDAPSGFPQNAKRPLLRQPLNYPAGCHALERSHDGVQPESQPCNGPANLEET